MKIVSLPAALQPTALGLWHECGLTRPWNDPEQDLVRALAGPSSTVLAGLADDGDGGDDGDDGDDGDGGDGGDDGDDGDGRGGGDGDDDHGGAELLGTVMVGVDGHRGWVYYLAVLDEHRGHGLGQLLMAAAEQWLLAHGAPKAQLMVRGGNDAALGFYAQLGYEPADVVVLGRRLDLALPHDPA